MDHAFSNNFSEKVTQDEKKAFINKALKSLFAITDANPSNTQKKNLDILTQNENYKMVVGKAFPFIQTSTLEDREKLALTNFLVGSAIPSVIMHEISKIDYTKEDNLSRFIDLLVIGLNSDLKDFTSSPLWEKMVEFLVHFDMASASKDDVEADNAKNVLKEFYTKLFLNDNLNRETKKQIISDMEAYASSSYDYIKGLINSNEKTKWLLEKDAE